MGRKTRHKTEELKLSHIIVILFVLAGIGFIIYHEATGWDWTRSFNYDVTCEVSSYWLAEYSEVEVGIDFEGSPYTDYDSWVEQASEVWFVTTVNGKKEDSNTDFTRQVASDSYWDLYSQPPKDMSFKKKSGFDNFRPVIDRSCKVYFGKYTFSIDCDSYRAYVLSKKANRPIYIRTHHKKPSSIQLGPPSGK